MSLWGTSTGAFLSAVVVVVVVLVSAMSDKVDKRLKECVGVSVLPGGPESLLRATGTI